MTTAGVTSRVSVILVTYNSGDELPECLNAVRAETELSQIEIIVVDNNSQDDSAAVASGYPPIDIVSNERNVGFARAVNQAIARSTGEYLLLLNPDAKLGPGAFLAMVKFLDAHPVAAIVGPKIVDSHGRLVRSCRTFPSVTTLLSQMTGLASRFPRHPFFGAATLSNWSYATERSVDYASGACLLIRRAALDRVGLFDEAYFMYVEEMDLSWRLWQAGWEIWFTPTAVVSHLGGRSAAKVKQVHGFEPLLLEAYYTGQIRFWHRYRGRFGLLTWRVLTSASSLIQAGRSLPAAMARSAQDRDVAGRRRRRALYIARLAWSSVAESVPAGEGDVKSREK